MKFRIIAAISTTLLAMSGVAAAQAGDVTLRVPLNLTRMSPDITKIKVSCTLMDAGSQRIPLESNVEAVVSGGEVVTTLSVLFQVANSALSGATGTQANYYCQLFGWFDPQPSWDTFRGNHQIPAFRVSPQPNPISGHFIW